MTEHLSPEDWEDEDVTTRTDYAIALATVAGAILLLGLFIFAVIGVVIT